jgi:hypothetical protein
MKSEKNPVRVWVIKDKNGYVKKTLPQYDPADKKPADLDKDNKWELFVLPGSTVGKSWFYDQYSRIATAELNGYAAAMGYDTYHTAMSYIGSPVEKYNAEGKKVQEVASKTWEYVEDLIDQVVSDKIEPVSEDSLVQSLRKLQQ